VNKWVNEKVNKRNVHFHRLKK